MEFWGFVRTLTVEVNFKDINSLSSFLRAHLGDKHIEIEVEAEDKQLKIKAKATSQEDIDAAMKATRDFFEEQNPIVEEVPTLSSVKQKENQASALDIPKDLL